MQPRSGHTSEASDVGPVVTHHMPPRHTAHGVASLVAASALYRAENLQPFTQTSLKGVTRVPATVTAAPDALAQAAPQAMLPLLEGYRDQRLASHDGGLAHCWSMLGSERRRPPGAAHGRSALAETAHPSRPSVPEAGSYRMCLCSRGTAGTEHLDAEFEGHQPPGGDHSTRVTRCQAGSAGANHSPQPVGLP
jgi:hypothetical protein